MARRNTSAAEDVVDLIAKFPWWVGVVSAVLFYVVLHYVANQAITTSVPPGQVGVLVTQTLALSLAALGQ